MGRWPYSTTNENCNPKINFNFNLGAEHLTFDRHVYLLNPYQEGDSGADRAGGDEVPGHASVFRKEKKAHRPAKTCQSCSGIVISNSRILTSVHSITYQTKPIASKFQ